MISFMRAVLRMRSSSRGGLPKDIFVPAPRTETATPSSLANLHSSLVSSTDPSSATKDGSTPSTASSGVASRACSAPTILCRSDRETFLVWVSMRSPQKFSASPAFWTGCMRKGPGRSPHRRGVGKTLPGLQIWCGSKAHLRSPKVSRSSLENILGMYFILSTPMPCSPVREPPRSEEHTSELQSRQYLVCRLLLEKKKYHTISSFDRYANFRFAFYHHTSTSCKHRCPHAAWITLYRAGSHRGRAPDALPLPSAVLY